jgi:hypothetical protein
MPNELSEILQSLPPTGPNGFEGLVVRLLERLTGLRFHLARSGSQEGRDARSDLPTGGSIAVECKRYGIGNALGSRELLAELQQAISSIPSLDIWILAATRSIPDQILSELLAFAADRGIDILALDSPPDRAGSLDFLCAAFPGVLSEMCPAASVALGPILSQLQLSGGFDSAIQHLRNRILTASGGWPVWRDRSHESWQSFMQDSTRARSRFGYPLAVLSRATYSVPRLSIESALDAWWNERRSTIFAAIGEEGDGKSWAIAQWLTTRTAPPIHSEFPPLVFVPSKDTGNPRNIIDLLEENLNQDFEGAQWRRRLNRWIESPVNRGNGPVAVVVLDGLNERHLPGYWRNLLESVGDSNLASRVSVICTARARYWQEHFSGLSHLHATVAEVPPFSDEELTAALSARNKSLSDYPADLRPLLRKPRYLDLVMRHSQEMLEAGDFTVARLIFEDWRDRRSRRDQPLSEEAFNDLLKQLGEKYREGFPIRGGDLTAMLSPEIESVAAVRELQTSGVLVSKDGRWRVDEFRLSFALGLLLCDHVSNVEEAARNTDEEIASWLEPHTGSDIESAILEYAFLCSISRALSTTSASRLLLAWISSQNPRSPRGAPLEEGITAYLPQAVDAFISVAEVIWSKGGDNPWAQEVFLKGFVDWSARSEEIAQRLRPTLERWLSMFSVTGPHYVNGPSQVDSKQKELEERLRNLFGAIEIGTACALAGYPLLPIEDNYWLRLGHVALSIISQFRDRRPYVVALVQGVLADAVSESAGRTDEIKWLIRSSDIPLEADLGKHIQGLIGDRSAASQKAAAYLLRYIGSDSAWRVRKSMDLDGLFPTPDWVISARENPVESAFVPSSPRAIEDYSQRVQFNAWAFIRSAQTFMKDPELSLPGDIRQKLQPCLSALDPAAIWTGMWRTADDLRFEEIERVFLRVAPGAIADLVRTMCKDVGNRPPKALLSLGYHLDEYDLLLDRPSRDALWQLLSSRVREFNASDPTGNQIEYQFFQLVLWLWEGREQLDRILSRSEQAFDNRDFLYSYRGTISEPIPTPVSEAAWFRVLYFLGTIGSAPLSTEQLKDACSSPSSLVRGAAFRYVYQCSLESQLPPDFDRKWKWTSDQHEMEQYYGSLLLIGKCAESGPGEWIEWVEPSHRSAALKAAGASDEDWTEYLQWLDASLNLMGRFRASTTATRRIVECGNSDRTQAGDVRLEPEPAASIRIVAPESVWGGRFSEWPPKWPPGPEAERDQRTTRYAEIEEENKKAIAAGHFWLQRCFPTIGLEKAAALEPRMIDAWIEQLESDTLLRVQAGSFYIALLEVLAKREEWHGSVQRIYRALKSAGTLTRFIDGETQLDLLDCAVFSALESESLRPVWIERFDSCTCDKDLLEFALLIRRNGRANGCAGWLKRHLDGMLASEMLFERAKAIALKGFIEQDEDVFGPGDDQDDLAWVDEVRRTARTRVRAERFARYWFSRFCTADGLVDAWAAYRLFIMSADRRCLLWCHHDLRELRAGSRKEAFFATNIQRLLNICRENEKKLAETFLNCKVTESLAPWLTLRM